MAPLIPPSSAFEHISASLTRISTETVTLSEARDRILQTPIVADRPVPPFDRAMMDGIAIPSSANLKKWNIAGTQSAGSPALTLPSQSDCFEVMTGAVVPEGCDTVIPIEELSIQNGTATLSSNYAYQAGDFIHGTGSDHPKGATLVAAGTKLTAPELAIAASCGATALTVSRLPRITLITSGDEVIPPELTPELFQIRASHPTVIANLIAENNLGQFTHTHIADSERATRKAIQTALSNSDVLVLTGGVSKGKFDYVAPILRELVGEPLFHGISQRPGKPMAFFDSNVPIFALPGNPLSVMACMARYVIPALQQILGAPATSCQLELANDAKTFPHLTHLLAAKIVDGKIHSAAPNNSGDYSALLSCQGVVEMHSAKQPLAAGSTCTFYPW